MKRGAISDHAIVRFLERTGRLDIKKLIDEILAPDVMAAMKLGACSLDKDGMTYIFENKRLVTIFDNTARGYRPRKWKGQVA